METEGHAIKDKTIVSGMSPASQDEAVQSSIPIFASVRLEPCYLMQATGKRTIAPCRRFPSCGRDQRFVFSRISEWKIKFLPHDLTRRSTAEEGNLIE